MAVTSVGTPSPARSTTSGYNSGTWGSGQARTAGNLLVATVTMGSDTVVSAVPSESTSTWTLSFYALDGTGHVLSAVFIKTAAGGDAAPLIYTAWSGNGSSVITLLELSGSTNTVDCYGTWFTASAGTLTPTATASAATTAAGDFVLSGTAIMRTAATNTWTPGTGFTNLYSDGSTSSATHSSLDYATSSPALGATPSDAGNWAAETSADGCGFIVAFKSGMAEIPGPAYNANDTWTVTTTGYTPVANTLQVAVVALGNGGGGTVSAMSVTGSSTGAWTLIGHNGGVGSTQGVVAVFAHDAGASPSMETVALSFSPFGPCLNVGMIIRQFNHAAPAASQPGVTASTTADVFQLAITPGTTGSQVVGGLALAGAQTTLAANGATTFYGTTTGPSDNSTIALFEATSLSTAGTPVTAGSGHAVPAQSDTMFLLEILPAGIAPLPAGASGTGSMTVTGHKAVTGHVTESATGSLAVASLVTSGPSGCAAAGGMIVTGRKADGAHSAITATGTSTATPGGGVTYYVSAAGNDSNNGLSAGAPWATVAKVNAATLAPGTTVLFRGGDTFSGTALAPAQSGTLASPITFGSYGTGQATLSNGSASGWGILIYNVGGFVIQNLTITGTGTLNSSAYSGIWIVSQGAGQLPGFTITNCTISGWQYGVAWGASAATDGFSNITLTSVNASGNSYAGIWSWTSWTFNPSAPAYSFSSVAITNCTASNNLGNPTTGNQTGTGILVASCNGGTVTGCTAAGNGTLNACTTSGPTGIWTFVSNNVVISNCVAYGNSSNTSVDGEGFDIDLGCTNCVIEYCLAYSNGGGGIMCFGDPAAPGHAGNTIRYNLTWGNSQRNGLNNYGEICVDGTITNDSVYGNTCIAVDNGSLHNVPFVAVGGGTYTGVTVRNNIFYATGQGQVAYTYQPATLTTAGILLQGNLYWSAGTFALFWNGTTYSSLAAFQAGQSGQEEVSGSPAGLQANPLLAAPGTAPAVTGPGNLGGADGLKPTGASPVIGAGLNLQSLFSVSPGTQDVFGNLLSVPLWIGASAVSAGTAVAGTGSIIVTGYAGAPATGAMHLLVPAYSYPASGASSPYWETLYASAPELKYLVADVNSGNLGGSADTRLCRGDRGGAGHARHHRRRLRRHRARVDAAGHHRDQHRPLPVRITASPAFSSTTRPPIPGISGITRRCAT